jgi:general secretion pathway protein J
MRRAAGFTLLEVLLATTLLAAGLALGFATLRAASATATRGEAMAARNERMRAVSAFLRQRIGGAQGMVFELDKATGQARRFDGDATRMRFVADLPDYLGRGGPHLHELAADGPALDIQFRMVLAGEQVRDRDARPPEPLAEGLRSVAFAYRGPSRDGQPAEWAPAWTEVQALPYQVRVRISDAAGAWPDLIIALPMAASYGGTGVVP